MAHHNTRCDGWTLDRKICFLTELMSGSNVSAAAAAVGLSRTAAYALARRDRAFADTWAEALELARPQPEPLPPLFEQLDTLPNAVVMHRLRRYNIGRGRTFLPR